ncbi:MAG: hypothetical protein LBS00_10340 [Synergistaceae bacterium]|jgi:hypothetical protein|nr:hypothetical protein [Synergistaceae bacterium]
MLQPVNLQLAHFNIEHSAQISKDAIAAAQQTAQGQEAVQESVKRTRMVQANVAAAESQKVKRKTEDDERERRREEHKRSFSHSFSVGSDSFEEGPEIEAQTAKKDSPKGFDFYA